MAKALFESILHRLLSGRKVQLRENMMVTGEVCEVLSYSALLHPDETAASPLALTFTHALSRTGKQLRPQVVRYASELGPASRKRVLASMRAVELLHMATLLHDDVMDDSRLRRGEPSVYHRFGARAAQCSGAWMMGFALRLTASLDSDAIELFALTVGELCTGQMLETQQLWDVRRSQHDYERAVRGKTASLFKLSAQMGGLAAGVGDGVLAALGTFGESFGAAFQLVDDLLDILGDPVKTGKDRGTDIRQGVYTLPLLFALEHDSRLLIAPSAYEDLDVECVVGRILSTDAIPRAVTRCEEHLYEAATAIEGLQASGLLGLVDQCRCNLRAVA